MQWKWMAAKKHSGYYARRGIRIGLRKYNKRQAFYMHREIMNTTSNMQVDHIDHNTLNNQKSNLRICTHQQNQMNRIPWGSSEFLGVSFRKERNCYSAKIMLNQKSINIGHFKIEEDAARAYDIKAKELFGEFANLNFKD
jgi:hypothetical protein